MIKFINVFLGIGFLYLAVLYPFTDTMPSMFTVVLMCLVISMACFKDFMRQRHFEVKSGGIKNRSK